MRRTLYSDREISVAVAFTDNPSLTPASSASVYAPGRPRLMLSVMLRTKRTAPYVRLRA